MLSGTFQSMKEKAIKKKTDKQKHKQTEIKSKPFLQNSPFFPFEKNLRLLPNEFLEDMCRRMSS